MRKITMLIMAAFCAFSFCAVGAQEEEQGMYMPRKAEVDSNYDGIIDRVEYYNDNGQIMKVEMDTTGDGKINEWVTYRDARPTKSERDTNADGKIDIWMEY
jgi:hypothetical protein